MRSKQRRVRFANETEEQFAALLRRLRLRWRYEPHTFVLRKKSDGTPALAFTPDFYLPDVGLYFELTTLQRKLVTAKNRKARLLSEQRPDVRLRVLYRRDCLELIRPARSRRSRAALLGKLLSAPNEESIRRASWVLRLQRVADSGGHVSVMGIRLPLGQMCAGSRVTVWVYPSSLEVERDEYPVATFPCTYDARTRRLVSVEPGRIIHPTGQEQGRLALPELERASPSRRSFRRAADRRSLEQLSLSL